MFEKLLALALFAAVVVCSGSAPASSAQTTLVTVRFALVPTEVSALAYYANDLGYFRDVGIDAQVAPLGNGGVIVAAVTGGSIEIGFSNVLSLIVAHSKGIPLSLILGTDVYQASNPTEGALAVPKASPIHDARDLDGKIIGVASLSNTSFYALRLWIDEHGGNSANAHYLEIPQVAVADAVIAQRVDAGVMDYATIHAERVASALRQIGLTYSAIAPRFLAGGWVAKPDWIQQHPDTARAVVVALRRAAAWANAHPADAIAIYAKHGNLTLADLQAAPRPYFDLGSITPLIEPMIKLAVSYGAIKTAFPARDLVSSLTK